MIVFIKFVMELHFLYERLSSHWEHFEQSVLNITWVKTNLAMFL